MTGTGTGASGDEIAISSVAERLLCHYEKLKDTPKKRDQVGAAEIGQRTYLLFKTCRERGILPPDALMRLLAAVLDIGGDPVSPAQSRTQEAWWRAVQFEAAQPFDLQEPQKPSTASLSAVMRAAFPDETAPSDHRKTVRAWRDGKGYWLAVNNLRACREVHGADVSDEMQRLGFAGSNPYALLLDLGEKD